jgi:DNA-binding transcriptional LysR family regulator
MISILERMDDRVNNLWIETFLTIAQIRNLSKAAEYLNITQSTISHRLKLLEEEIGFKLIERSKGIRETNLTEMGKKFTPLAERWLSLSRDIELFQQNEPKQSLIIGAVTSVNTYVLAPFYRLLTEHTPSIDLKIRTQHSSELYDLIEHKEIDLGFTLLERHIPNINVRPFFSEPMVVVRQGFSEPIETIYPTELKAENELFINWNPTYTNWHDKWWKTAISCVHLDTAQLIPSLMVNVNQWAIVPLTIALSIQTGGNFKIQYISDPPPVRICFLITHKQTKSGVDQCIQILNQYAQDKFNAFGIHWF